ncbi:uncharacterized protein [Euphorbia lathyris]|uniref:uncharacterized protein n=1 Tax=Euphorbia lathyris TaxID=212925 RepID=UPI003313D0F5
MEDFEQKMERYHREFHERQQRFDEQWELLRKKQQEKDEQVRKSLSNLLQSIREFRRVTDPSSIAPQVFDEKSEQKLEVADFKMQGKTVEIVEQLHQQKQTATMVVLELQTEKVNPENSDSYFINRLKPENQFESRSHPSIDLFKQATFQDIPFDDVIKAPKPNPTFRSPLAPKQWLQAHLSHTKTSVEVNLTPITTQKPNPTSRSSLTTSSCTQNAPNKLDIFPETILLPMFSQKTLNSLPFGINGRNSSVGQAIGSPFSYNHDVIIGSSLSSSTTPNPQLVTKALGPCLTSIRQRRPLASKKGGVNDSRSFIGVLFRVGRKEFWFLSTVDTILTEFIPTLSHDASGFSFQGWDDSYDTRTHEGILKWRDLSCISEPDPSLLEHFRIIQGPSEHFWDSSGTIRALFGSPGT